MRYLQMMCDLYRAKAGAPLSSLIQVGGKDPQSDAPRLFALSRAAARGGATTIDLFFSEDRRNRRTYRFRASAQYDMIVFR